MTVDGSGLLIFISGLDTVFLSLGGSVMYTLASHWYILLMIGISDFLERCLALPIRLVTSLPSLDSIVKQGFLQEYFLNDCKVKRVS